MRRLIVAVVCALSLSGCALNTSVPVLNPTTATAITNGLSALSNILHNQTGVPSGVFTAITSAQQAIAQDVNGTTWGGLLRTLLSNLYAELPQAVLDKPIVWASLAALEVALATIGA